MLHSSLLVHVSSLAGWKLLFVRPDSGVEDFEGLGDSEGTASRERHAQRGGTNSHVRFRDVSGSLAAMLPYDR